MWDLSDLDDALPVDSESVASLAARVAGDRWSSDAGELAALLGEMERLSRSALRASIAAFLRHSVDVGDHTIAARMQSAQEQVARLWSAGLALAHRWRGLEPSRRDALAADPALAPHRRLLALTASSEGDRGLSEPEERIVAEKALTGITAWQRLFANLVDELRVRLDGDGMLADDGAGAGPREMSLEEALGLLEQGDAALRRRVASAISRALQPGLATRAFVLSTVALDRIVDDRLRGQGEWLGHTSEANGVPASTTRAVIDAVGHAHAACRRFYRLKARLMGCDRMSFDADRLAPIAGDDHRIRWDDARGFVSDALDRVAPELGAVSRRAFDGGWIDARPHARKQPHATTVMVPGGHPYILLSYTGSLRSLLTLAHEMGAALPHGVAPARTLAESFVPPVVTEAVSLLCERIVLHHAIDVDESPARRLSLRLTILDSIANMVFRHVLMTRFEVALRAARESRGELTAETISGMWMDEHRVLLGEDVDLPERFSSWWSVVPHLVVAPGNEHLHATACLVAQAVHRRLASGEIQGAALVDMLRAAASAAPEEIVGRVGVELSDPTLWRRELDAFEAEVAEAESLAGALPGLR